MPFANDFLPEFDYEMKATRWLLERVPFAKALWKPHARSTALGALASHVANLTGLGVIIANERGRDIAKLTPEERRGTQYHTTDELLAAFDARVTASREALAALTEPMLSETWTLWNADQVIFARPRAVVLRLFFMNHLVHHRAQLGVYLRLNDVPLPAIYGPTADTA